MTAETITDTKPQGSAPHPGGLTKKQAATAEIFGDPIHTYSREQALEDGFLVDVSETAREAGFESAGSESSNPAALKPHHPFPGSLAGG